MDARASTTRGARAAERVGSRRRRRRRGRSRRSPDEGASTRARRADASDATHGRRGVASSWVLTVDVDDGDGVVFERGAARAAGRGTRTTGGERAGLLAAGADAGDGGAAGARGRGATTDGARRERARATRARGGAACVVGAGGPGGGSRASRGAETSGRERGGGGGRRSAGRRGSGGRRRGARAETRRRPPRPPSGGAKPRAVSWCLTKRRSIRARNGIKLLREAAYGREGGVAVDAGGVTQSSARRGARRFQTPARRLAALSDHVYVVCMKCDRIVLPLQWAGKVTTVHGADIDPCYGRAAADHWHKASMSHVHALLDAVKYQYKTVTIVEEDAITVATRSRGRQRGVRHRRLRARDQE